MKLLAAPYKPAQNTSSHDFKCCNTKDNAVCTINRQSDRFKFSNCIATKSQIYPNFNESDSVQGAVAATPTRMESISGSLKVESTASNDGKNPNEFTPTKESVYMAVGDNQCSNKLSTGAWCEIPALQPMKQWEVAASVINMPSRSQIQGQSFSVSPRPQPPPMQHHKQHPGSISQPAISPCSYSQCSTIPDSDQRPATSGRGWRRDTRSATMYTRYRSPELFSLMYSDQESSTTAVGNQPQTSDSRYRSIR